MRTLRLAALAGGLALAACGQNDNDPGPGGVTVGEAKALDEAAEMLEERGRTPADVQAEREAAARAAQGAAPADRPAGE